MKRRRSRSPELSSEAHELLLFAENESSLYPKKKMILENLKKKIASGKYDPRLAPTLWGYWVEDAARLYGKEFLNPGEWAKVFSTKTRKEVADELSHREHAALIAGEYGPIGLPKKKPTMGSPRRKRSARSPSQTCNCQLGGSYCDVNHDPSTCPCRLCKSATKAIETIEAAEKKIGHGTMVSSAKLSLRDAKELYRSGRYEAATKRAITSMKYSIGILHPDYRKYSGSPPRRRRRR